MWYPNVGWWFSRKFMRSSSYLVCFSHFLRAATVFVIFFHRLSSIFFTTTISILHMKDARQLWLRLHWHWLICKLQFIIHLNNKEYLIEILCDSIFLSISQIWQQQFNQVLVPILDSAVHLPDLNDLIDAKSPLNKEPKISTSTTPIPPAICVSKNMQKNYLRHVKWCGTPLIIKAQ